MGTEKRERQKANRAKRREEELKAARTTKVKRTALRWTIAALLAVGAVVLIAWIGGAFDGEDEPPVPTLPVNIPVTTAPAATAPASTAPATTVPATTAP